MSKGIKQAAAWLAILLMAFVQPLRAQTPVQVTPQLLPPYSLQVSEYYSGMQPKLQVLLLNRDINQPNIQVKLRMTVESQNCKLRTKDNAVTPTFTLTNGIPYYLTPQDLQAFFSSANLEFGGGYSQQQYEQTGRLPEGLYSFYFEAFELYSGNLVSNKGFTLGWLTLADPPLLNTPAKAEGIIPATPQNIVFNWTPRHNTSPTAGYVTDYVFSITEIADVNISPEQAFASGQPLFKDSNIQTTTYLYGAGQPQLIAGKRYAWRVQAKAKNGGQQLAMFRNNGFSEVYWFTYQNNCAVPLGITATVQGTRVTIEWQNNPQHLQWKVEYREKNNPNAEWFSMTNTLPRVMIMDLKPGTQYEYRVGGACQVDQFTYSALNSFSTAGAPVPPVANCGDSTLPAQGSGQTLQVLNVGDSIRAGSFTVHVGHTSGSGNFTGMGYVKVPWLMNAKVEVRFTNITLSLDKKLLSGIIETTYDPTESGIEDIDEYVDLFTGGHGLGGVVTGETMADTTLNVTIQWPGGIAVSPMPPPANGQVTLTITPQGGGNPITITTTHLPTTIMDAGGNIYQVAANGQVTQVGKPGGKALLDKTNKKVIDGDKALVRFTGTPTPKYAFDDWQPAYKKSNTFSKEYEKVPCVSGGLSIDGGDYYVSAKAIAPGEADTVYAIVRKPAGSTINKDSIQFINGKGTIYNRTVVNDSTYAVEIIGGPAKDAQDIYALYSQGANKTLNFGKVLVASYPRKEYEIVLAPINGNTLDNNVVSAALNGLYNKLNVFFTVTSSANFNTNVYFNNGVDELNISESQAFTLYSAGMKKLRDAYRNNFNTVNNKYYLFVLPKGNIPNVAGEMIRGTRFGFVFKNYVTTSNINSLVAHEIGHGIFSLKHLNGNYGFDSVAVPANNLMNKVISNNFLSKAEWDLVHDPVMVVNMFDNVSGSFAITDIEGGTTVDPDDLQVTNNNPNSSEICSGHYHVGPDGIPFKYDYAKYVAIIHNFQSSDYFPYVVMGLENKETQAIYSAIMKENMFNGFGIVNKTTKEVTPLPAGVIEQRPKAGEKVPVSFSQDYGDKCFYKEIRLCDYETPAGPLDRYKTIDKIEAFFTQKEVELDKWEGKTIYKKAGTEECKLENLNKISIDTSNLLNAGAVAQDILEKFKKLLDKSTKVNPYTKMKYVVKGNVLVSYTDNSKNKKPVTIDFLSNPNGSLKVGNDFYYVSANEFTIWVEITDNNKYVIKHVQLGSFLDKQIKESWEGVGRGFVWNQKNFLQKAFQVGEELVEAIFDIGYQILDWASSIIAKAKIKEGVYNPANPAYNDTDNEIWRRTLRFLMPGAVIEKLMQDYLTLPVCGDPEYLGKLKFAFFCGIYNGLIDVVQSVPELLKLITLIGSPMQQAEAKKFLQQFLDQPLYKEDGVTIECQPGGSFENVRCKLWNIIKSEFALTCENGPNLAHTVGNFVAPILIACFGDVLALEGPLATISSTIVKALRWCDKFGDMFTHIGGAFKLLKPATGRLLMQISDKLNGVSRIFIERLAIPINNKIFRLRIYLEAAATFYRDFREILVDEVKMAAILDGNHHINNTPFDIDGQKYIFFAKELLDHAKNVQRNFFQSVHNLSDELKAGFLKYIPIEGDLSTLLTKCANIPGFNKEKLLRAIERVAELQGNTDEFVKDLMSSSALREYLHTAGGNAYDPKAWVVLNKAGRKGLAKDAAALAKIDDMLANNTLKEIYGESLQDELVRICKANSSYFNGVSPLVNHLDDFLAFMTKFGGKNPNGTFKIEGFDKLLKEFANTGSTVQDGLRHMMNYLNQPGFDASKVKRFDCLFEEAGLPCVNCRFDVEMNTSIDALSTTKYFEFKSYLEPSKISLKQFLNYIGSVKDLRQLKYVFNAAKLGSDALNTAKKEVKKFLTKGTNAADIIATMKPEVRAALGLDITSTSFTESQLDAIVNSIVDVK